MRLLLSVALTVCFNSGLVAQQAGPGAPPPDSSYVEITNHNLNAANAIPSGVNIAASATFVCHVALVELGPWEVESSLDVFYNNFVTFDQVTVFLGQSPQGLPYKVFPGQTATWTFTTPMTPSPWVSAANSAAANSTFESTAHIEGKSMQWFGSDTDASVKVTTLR